MAVDAAGTDMNNGNYSLPTGDPENDYFNLFVQTDYGGHPEVLLYRQYDFVTHGVQNSLWIQPLFEEDATLAELPINRDPRLGQSVMVPGDLDFVIPTGDKVSI